MEERVLPPEIRLKIVFAQANAVEQEEERLEADVSLNQHTKFYIGFFPTKVSSWFQNVEIRSANLPGRKRKRLARNSWCGDKRGVGANVLRGFSVRGLGVCRSTSP